MRGRFSEFCRLRDSLKRPLIRLAPKKEGAIHLPPQGGKGKKVSVIVTRDSPGLGDALELG